MQLLGIPAPKYDYLLGVTASILPNVKTDPKAIFKCLQTLHYTTRE